MIEKHQAEDSVDGYLQWITSRETFLRNKAESEKSFNGAVKHKVAATKYWKEKEEFNRKKKEPTMEHIRKLEGLGESDTGRNLIQEECGKPILMGGGMP